MAGVRVPVTFDGDFSTLLQGLDTSLAGVGKVIGGTLQAAAATAGAGIAAVLGASLTSGFGRLVAIDDARAKLMALGSSATQVDSIMQTVTASVKGTSFGLGEAATAAASAIAAGIEPGEQLATALRQIGALATVTGGDFNELAAIYNQVAATGRVTGDTLNQLAERGSDVQKRLAEFFGVTQEEVREMASEGKISFADFQNALKGLDNAAKIAGTSFSATFANLRASLARIGANLLKPIFDQLGGAEGVFARLTAALGPVEDRAKVVGEALGRAFTAGITAIERLSTVIGPLWDRLGSGGQIAVVIGGIAASFGALAGTLAGMFPVLSPLLGGFGSLSSVLTLVGGALRFLVGPVGIVIGLLASAWATSEPFRDSVMQLGQTLLTVGQQVLPTVIATGQILAQQVLPQLAAIFTTVATNVGSLLAAVVPLIGALIAQFLPVVAQVAQSLAGLLAAILPVVNSLLSQLLPVIVNLATTVIPQLIPVLGQVASILGQVLPPAIGLVTQLFQALGPIISALLPIVTSVFQTLAGLIGGAINIFQGLITFLQGAFTGNWSQAWQGIQQIFAGIVQAIMAIVQGWVRNFEMMVGASMDQVLNTIRVGWTNIWNRFVQGGVQIVQAVQSAFRSVVSGIASGVSSALARVRAGWNAIVSATTSAFSRIVSSIRSALSSAVSTITSGWARARSATSAAFSSIRNAVSSAISSLVSRVRSGFSSVVSAITSAFSRMVSAARSGVGRVVDVVRGLAGRARSAASNLAGALFSAGSQLINGLVGGIRSAAGRVASAARSVVQNAINAARSALGIASPSKVFMEIGKNTGQGMALGLESTRQLVQAAANSSLVPSLSGPRTSSTAHAVAARRAADVADPVASVVLNEYGPRTDSAKRREIDWQLKHPTRGRTFETGTLAVR